MILLGSPFADHRAWSSFLAAVEPGRPPDAHFDLRAAGIDPLTAPLDRVTAVATYYTADLADADWDLDRLAAQLRRVVGRVRLLTGRPSVFLVAHSTAGLVARRYAAVDPVAVTGVVTIGTPHAGSPLAPLADEGLADAVRLAGSMAAAADGAPAPVVRAVEQLGRLLDRVTAPLPPAAFAGSAPPAASPAPGLVVASTLAQDLVGALAAALADRLDQLAAGAAAAPTHLGLGLRGAARRPHARQRRDRPRRRCARRPGARQPRAQCAGAGGAAAAHRADARRRARRRLGRGRRRHGRRRASRQPAAAARARRCARARARRRRVVCADTFRLLDAAALGVTTPLLELADVAGQIDALALTQPLALPDPPAGTTAGFLFDLLAAMGIVVTAPEGTGRGLSLDALRRLASEPAALLAPRVGLILDAVGPSIGAARLPGGTWTLSPAVAPLLLSVTPAPWTLALSTGADETQPIRLAGALAVGLDARVELPGFARAADLTLALGPIEAASSNADGGVRLERPGLARGDRCPPRRAGRAARVAGRSGGTGRGRGGRGRRARAPGAFRHPPRLARRALHGTPRLAARSRAPRRRRRIGTRSREGDGSA